MIDPTLILQLICPDASSMKSCPSSGVIGTAYGNYLGTKYMCDRPPRTYGIVDHSVWLGWGGWEARAKITELWKYDPKVAQALINSSWNSYPWRTDILDADLDAVYEIKPVRSKDLGPPQLQRYLDALSQSAPKRPDGTNRNWLGGGAGDPWDPSRYPMVIPVAGKICIVCSWQDEDTPGLILYDIVCCKFPQLEPLAAYCSATQLVENSFPSELANIKPTVETWIANQLPLAPTGSTYVLLMSRRFYEGHVLIPRAIQSGRVRQQDRLIEAQYGPRPGPALTSLVAATWVGAHVLAGPVADIPMVSSGWLSPEAVNRLYKAQALAGTALSALCLVAMPLAAVDAAALTAAPVAEVSEVASDLSAVENLTAAPEIPASWPGTPGPPGPNPFLDGTGELLQVGRSLPAWPVNVAQSSVPMSNASLGVIGAFLIAALAPDAQAGTGNSPPSGTLLLGADPVYLVPVEMVTSIDGEAKVDTRVKFGGLDYYIGGIVTAGTSS